MKFPLLLALPFALVACTTQESVPVVLPPVTTTKTTATTKTTSTYNKPKPKVVEKTVVTEEVKPLTPDPTKLTPVSKIPRYEVPENIQPKVSDGINQAVFIELQW